MADEPEESGEKNQKGEPEWNGGPWPPGYRPKGAMPPWEKGKSPNPGGLPKGYVKVNKRLANYLGTEEGWQKIKRKLDRLLEDDSDDVEDLKLIQMVVNNDHQLDRNAHGSDIEKPPPPDIVIENADRHEDEKE